MHPALQIDDIQHLIFERLQPRDLARVARTCNAFFDSATQELSKTITSLSPLLCCLPPDYRGRPLQAEDLHRLDLYASKVQNLLLETERSLICLPLQFKPKNQSKTNPEKSWEELWQEIASLRPTSEFLPNLRRLRISKVAEELLIPLIGISGSKLNQISIKNIHRTQPQSIVFQILDLLQETPKLENLVVRGGEPDFVPSKLIQKAPLKRLRLEPRMNSKRNLELQLYRFPLGSEVLQKSMLETLTLSLTWQWCSPGIKALNGRCLPALKTLWLDLTIFKLGAHSFGNQAPIIFFKSLNNPELSLLNIKFYFETTGVMFLDVISAANSSCRLKNLSELALASEVWTNNGPRRWVMRPAPNINSTDLREGLRMLLPLPKLKLLRLSVAPNFLDVLNVKLYKSITDGLPALEKLWLSHAEFTHYERTPLHHLAAFCSMLPNLAEVSMGTVDGLTLEKKPHKKWASLGVKSLTIQHWAGSDNYRQPAVSRDLLHLGLRTYFPNSDLAKKNFKRELSLFEQW
jgi:hypothetical protein